MIKEFVVVFSENLPDKLLLMCDIQHAIQLVSGASLLDLPHHKIDHVKHIEPESQVDELLLEIKQQCLISINTHIYQNKFWSYIMTKDVISLV